MGSARCCVIVSLQFQLRGLHQFMSQLRGITAETILSQQRYTSISTFTAATMFKMFAWTGRGNPAGPLSFTSTCGDTRTTLLWKPGGHGCTAIKPHFLLQWVCRIGDISTSQPVPLLTVDNRTHADITLIIQNGLNNHLLKLCSKSCNNLRIVIVTKKSYTQNHWISGLRSSSGILNARKHNVSGKWI
jgi:hypothetical protein